MSDWDEDSNCRAGDAAPAKLGMGRGNLAKVFGEKMRGIGRGNGFSEGRNSSENSFAPKENGFKGDSRGAFGSRTDEGSSDGFRKNNGFSGGGFGGRTDEGSSDGFSKKNSGFSGGGFGGRTDEGSSDGFSKKNSGFSGGGFGSRTDEGSSDGFSKKNSGFSGGRFGGRTDEGSSDGFSKKNSGFSGGGFGSRTDEGSSDGFSKKNSGFSGGGFGSRTDEGSSDGFRKNSGFSGGGFGSKTDEGSSDGFSRKNSGFSGGGFGSRTDEGSSDGFSNKNNNNSRGGFGRTGESSGMGFSGKSQGVSEGGFGSSNRCVNGDAEDDDSSRFGSRGGGGYRESKGRGGGGRESRPGDWTCSNSDCGNSNFAYRQTCHKCDTAKSSDDGGSNDFQGQGRGRSGGDRNERSGDWVCPDQDCGNKNFAYRTKCQKCETPKPENRNDAGGGRPGNRSGNSPPRPPPYIPPTPSEREEDIFGEAAPKGINFDKYEEIPVEVSGQNPCGFISSYDEAGLFPTILDNIQRAHYEKPTPIQKYSIPAIMAGRDLMACAQTGSGKTAAFLLPVLTAMTKLSPTPSHQRPQAPKAICVVPTRELAIQIHADCRKFAHKTDLRAVVVYGGTSIGNQFRQIDCGVDFVIGTPGRLLDIVQRGKLSLEGVSFLILDEADRMLDMGFEPDIRKLVETFGMPAKTQRQTLMFSATFPENIQELAADFLNNYLFVTVGRVGGANTDVSQNIFEVESHEKTNLLVEILSAEEGVKTLVFVNQKRFVDFLASYLCEMNITATSIHGDRLQQEREEALLDFKTGKRRVLVATSVAARGLDIPEVMHVVNYDLPQSVDEYVHRIGRTGRCGNLGKATSFFNSSNKLISSGLVKILKEAQQPVPDWLAAYSCGMFTDQEKFGNDRFGGKDIRRNNSNHGGRASDNADGNWAAGAGADCDTVNDDENWG